MIKQKKQGQLIVISGPSGTGKDTIVEKVLKKDKNTWLSVSATSRKIRKGEKEGVNYFYLTKEMDDGSVQASMPVTHALLNGHGTVQGGAVASLCDIAGAAYMRILVGDEVTLNSSMQFYRPGKEGSVLTARVTPRKLGKTICTIFCEVADETGTLIADSVQTFYRI